MQVIPVYTAKERLIKNLIFIPLICIVFMLFDFSGHSNFVNGKLMQHSSTNINESIETKIIEQTSDSITIEFTNKQSVDWIYSEYYSIEVFDQGIWCIVPFTENISVIDIAYILEPNKTSTHTYPLNHHTLYEGQYRIIIDSSSTEFEIKKASN